MQTQPGEIRTEDYHPAGGEHLRKEIEVFDDLDSYRELMNRPYTRRLKAEVDAYMSSLRLNGARVLELGCGISEHARLLNRNNEVILTDINRKLLEKNDPPSRLMLCDAQDLSVFEDDSIDFVIYIGVLHHLVDQAEALREARRVLKPGGRIFICEPHRRSLNLLYYYLRRLTIRVFGIRFLKRLIGCVSPQEKQLDCAAVERIFGDGYNVAKWTILSFRLPPLRLFRRSGIDVALSRFLDALPLFRNIGTTILYDIRSLEDPRSAGKKSKAMLKCDPPLVEESKGGRF